MILQQYYLGCLSQASYLIGDESSGTAVVVDPRRDVDLYLEEAAKHGLRIRHVVLTHFHADFVAGHLELRDRVGARIYLGRRAEAEYEFTALGDGDRIELGNVRIETLETPGHTPESICLAVFDLAADEKKPKAVLTGDTLFLGDVERPDLLASSGFTADELAGMLYDSLHQKILRLPGETLVYPGHGSGSFCGKNLSSETVATMESQRSSNYALQPMSKPAFTALIAGGQTDAPRYFSLDAELNRRERPTMEETLEGALKPLALEDVLRRANAGAHVLDVRSPDDFAAGHLSGSVNIGLGGKYASWAGTLLDHRFPIVITADAEREREAATRLMRIGFDRVAGYLEGGPRAWAAHPELVQRFPRLSPSELSQRLEGPNPPIVLDVRTEVERKAKSIEGSVGIPLALLPPRANELDRTRPIVVHCASGYRSSIAASLLERAGFARVSDLQGGIEAWQAAGLRTAVCAGT